MSINKTLNERENTHGDYVANASAAMTLISAAMSQPGWEKLPAYQQYTLIMGYVKDGRILAGNHNYDDHWHDKSCYPALVEKELTKEWNDTTTSQHTAKASSTTDEQQAIT